MAEYDKIAKEYSSTEGTHPKKKYMVFPSLFKLIGDLENKKILDLACGDGSFSRKLKKGATEIVGIDLSNEMIKIAKEKEKRKPLGITYLIGDAISLEKIKEFDVVIGGFLLHYSKTKEEIAGMCNSIYRNLKKGGRFIGVNANPDQPLTNKKKYGTTVQSKERLKEGSKINVTIYEDKKELCSFLNYHWSKETYEIALKNAGFKKINWHILEVSKEGKEKYGEDFWKDALRDNNLIIIEAIK